MPEIKHNFTGGKMEKDLDERIIPNGQYRDAFNIEVSTSEGSDIGTIQNILGNMKIQLDGQSWSVPPNSTCVGAVSDEKNNAIYWLIHSPLTNIQWNQVGSNFHVVPKTWKNFIVEYTRDKHTSVETMNIVLNDVYKAVDRLTNSNITYGNNTVTIGTLNSGFYKGVRVGARLKKVTSYQSGAYAVDAEVLKLGSGGQLHLSTIPPQLATFINDGDDIALEFHNPKVLGFSPTTRVTGINVVDGFLFFTDNVNEPKKINIERGKIGSQSSIGHSTHPNILNSMGLEPITEHHITVIKKGPTKAPRLDMKAKKINNINCNTSYDFTDKKKGDKITLNINNNNPSVTLATSYIDYQVGDIIRLKSAVSSSDDIYPIIAPDVRCEVLEITNNTNGSIIVEVRLKNEPNADNGMTFFAVDVEQITPEMFQDKFVQFATRYRYIDGEYSTFSPFSEYAFVAGKFDYNPKNGYNLGMENRLLSVEIKDFIPVDIPTDVVQVDILYKQSNSPSVYLAKSIKHTDVAPTNADYWSEIPMVTSPYNNWVDINGNINGGYSNEGGLARGSYKIDSESTVSMLPSNQILRHFDNVPRVALAQEVTANRLMYANYLQNYDIKKGSQHVSPTFTIDLDIRLREPVYGNWIGTENEKDPGLLNIPLRLFSYLEGGKSIKSMREYQLGIVYLDEYGRQTPVITDNSGIIKIDKSKGQFRTKLLVGVENHPEDIPSFAKYFKYYIKETSSEYYNLAMDRWYDAEGGNLWLSFFSADRNKVDEDTILQLKKMNGTQKAIKDDNKIKVVAIENEAPEWIKTTKQLLGNYDHDTTTIFSSSNNYPFANATYPIIIDKNVLTNAGVTDLHEKPGVMIRVFAKNMFIAGGTEVHSSKWYKCSDIAENGNDYILTLERKIGEDMSFTGELGSWAHVQNQFHIFLELAVGVVENKPEFDGRFFVKVKNDPQIQKFVQGIDETNVAWEIAAQRDFNYYHVDQDFVVGGGPNNLSVGPMKFDVGMPDYDAYSSGTSSTTALGCVNWVGNLYDPSPWFNAFMNTSQSLPEIAFSAGCPQPVIPNSSSPGSIYKSNAHTCGHSQWIIDALPFAGSQNEHPFSKSDKNSDPTSGVSLGIHGLDENGVGTATNKIDLSFIGIFFSDSVFASTGPNDNMHDVSEHHKEEANFIDSLRHGNAITFGNDPERKKYTIIGIEEKDLYNYHQGHDKGNAKNASWASGSNNARSHFGPAANRRKRWRLTLDRPIENIVTSAGAATAPDWVLPIANDCGTTSMKIQIWRTISIGSDTDIVTDKPAIFETEPKIKEDLDIYYEASNLLPVELNRQNFKTLVRPGMTISLHETQLKTTYAYTVANVTASATFQVDSLIDEFGSELLPGAALIMSSAGNITTTPPAYPLITSINSATNEITLNQAQTFLAGGQLTFGSAGLGGPNGSLDITPISGNNNNTGTEILDVKVIDDQLSITVKNINCSHPFQAVGGAPDGGLLHVGKGDLIRIWDVDSDSFMTFSLAHNYWDAPAVGDTHNGITPATLTGANQFVLGNPMPFNFNGEAWQNISEQAGYPNEIELRLDLTPPKQISLNWYNCYAYGNGVESDRIRDDFNQPIMGNGAIVSAVPEEQYKEERRKNSIIYSGIYNSTSGVNNLNQFILAEKITKDLNPKYGSIQKLHTRDTNLVVLCEDKVLKVLANKDAVFNADGNPQLIATGRTLGQVIPFIGEYGISKNPESFASESYRAYFTDLQRGSVMRLSKDGLTPISEHGMKNWFRQNLPSADKLVGSYDTRKDSYHLTLSKGTDDQPVAPWPQSKTVSFNERVRGWESFKSFIPEFGVSLHNDYYTIKNSELWRHYDGGFYSKFYNDQSYASFKAVLNDFSGSVKTFNTLSYEGSQSRIVQFQEEGIGSIMFNDNQYYNLNEEDGWYAEEIITDIGKSTQQEGMIDEFIEKEGKWFNYIKGKEELLVQTVNLDPNEFTFQGIGISGNVSIASLRGCTDPNATNYDPLATDPCCSACDGSDNNYCCIPCVNGCNDQAADNFNPNATCNDGSCIYTGCLDELAANYDPNANTACSSCCYPVIYGCTHPLASNYITPIGDVFVDVNTPCCTLCDNTDNNDCCIFPNLGCIDTAACNFDATANTDDGSCDYSCYGCTDPVACNYDPNATIDNGACAYCNYACLNPAAINYVNPANMANPAPCDAANPGCTNVSNPPCTGPGSGFGQCCELQQPDGCTDPNAMNYDPTAIIDDDSCCYFTDQSVTFQMERIGCGDATAGDNPDVNGYCNDGSGHPLYSGNTYVGYGPAFYGACPANTGWNTLNFDPLACGDCSQIQGGNDWSCCAWHVYGCTDPTALNADCGTIQNPNSTTPCADGVTIDDGSCTYNTDWGCTNATACNYDPTATFDDGTCEFTSCVGCTDHRYGYHQDINGLSNYDGVTQVAIGHNPGDINCTWCPSAPTGCNNFDLAAGTACTDDGTIHGKPIGFYAKNFNPQSNPSLPANNCCPGNYCNYEVGCADAGWSHQLGLNAIMQWGFNPIQGCSQTPGSVCQQYGGVYPGTPDPPNTYQSGNMTGYPAFNFGGSTQYLDDNGVWPAWNTSWVLPPYGDGILIMPNGPQQYSQQGMSNYGTACIPVIYGCIDLVGPNGEQNVNINSGCTTYNAWPDAQIHTNSPIPLNNDPYVQPNTHRQECCVLAVYGCTDQNAPNYDPNANYDDGSCCYGLGCPWPDAYQQMNVGNQVSDSGQTWNDITSGQGENLSTQDCIDYQTGQGGSVFDCYGNVVDLQGFLTGTGVTAFHPGNGVFDGEKLLMAMNGGNECESGLSGFGNTQNVTDKLMNTDGLLDPNAANDGKLSNDGSILFLRWEMEGHNFNLGQGMCTGWDDDMSMCCCRKAGCPDPLAMNFNPEACASNTNLCIYPFNPGSFCPPWSTLPIYSGITFPGCGGGN
jgi:hypothetical protein